MINALDPTKMWKSRAKLSANTCVNSVHYFVQNLYLFFYPHLNVIKLHHFTHNSHHFINSLSSPVAPKTFPLLHNPYHYYYDLYKYNNN